MGGGRGRRGGEGVEGGWKGCGGEKMGWMVGGGWERAGIGVWVEGGRGGQVHSPLLGWPVRGSGACVRREADGRKEALARPCLSPDLCVGPMLLRAFYNNPAIAIILPKCAVEGIA